MSQPDIICRKPRKSKCHSNDSIKRRGLYVERKTASSVLNDKDATSTQIKRKVSRPRPGQKKFLSSVLTLLSKSTASVQCPDNNEAPKDDRKEQRLKNKKNPKENTKYRYKSKILNQTLQDDFLILKSKKDISSPSYSGSVTVRWSDVIRSDNRIYSQILEGQKPNKEPETAIGNNETENKVLNLFVDLLETTISMYSNKEEIEKNDHLNDILEINEDVAKKLELPAKGDIGHEKILERVVDISDRSFNLPTSDTKLKVKSFIQPKKNKIIPKSKSHETKKSVKTKKKNLLAILKEQIETGLTFDEPQNLYQALKVMAKNKQRSDKLLSFYKFDKSGNDRRKQECVFRRRHLFTNPKKKSKNSKEFREYPNNDRAKVKEGNAKVLRHIPSYKSVEVYGYNYEEPVQADGNGRALVNDKSSSFSDLDYYALLKYPDTSASYFTNKYESFY